MLLGEDFFTEVVRIEAMRHDGKITDAWMEHLDDLPRTTSSWHSWNHGITNVGLEHL